MLSVYYADTIQPENGLEILKDHYQILVKIGQRLLFRYFFLIGIRVQITFRGDTNMTYVGGRGCG